jgi:hypothetical protein
VIRAGRFIRVIVLTTIAMISGSAMAAESWWVDFERVTVPPVARDNTTQLIEAGTITTDGFSELVFSLGGEFKEGVPTGGVIGALLIPDADLVQYAFEHEGHIPFALEAKHDIAKDGLEGAVFLSAQQTERGAFPRYRVFLYNETTSGASVSLFIYRSRCSP